MPAVRVKADVGEDRRVLLELPPDFPTGEVEVDVRTTDSQSEIVDLPMPVLEPTAGDRMRVERSGVVRDLGKPQP